MLTKRIASTLAAISGLVILLVETAPRLYV